MVYRLWTMDSKFFWLKKQTQVFSQSNDDHETYKTYQETSLTGKVPERLCMITNILRGLP